MVPSVTVHAWLLTVSAVALFAGWGGARFKQSEWDAAELQRMRENAATAARRVDVALDASAAYEKTRAAAAAESRRPRHDVDVALQAPVACAGQPLQLGELVLPAAALDGVRGAAIAGADRAEDPAEPGAALR